MKLSPAISGIVLLISSLQTYSQDYRQLRKNADSLYRAKSYQEAAWLYMGAAAAADFNLQKENGLYRAACCYSLVGNKDSAVVALGEAIRAGYNDKEHLLGDKDLQALHDSTAWRRIVEGVKPGEKVLHKEPRQASLITEDIHRFWQAYDLASRDTADRVAIYKRLYFDKASRGMEDYMGSKVGSIGGFVRHYDQHTLFYRAIRKNTLQTDSLKPAIYACFEKLKVIYPEAVYPDVYFVMGAFTSAGTVSDAGLLIGVNQVCKTDDIPLGELSLWERNNFNLLQNLPGIIAHELIHFQQDVLLKSDDTTTLMPVLTEGMADFLGEMISGRNINQRLHSWVKGKEKRIWQAFLKDMDFDRYGNWIANANQETADNPADQGYWIGYQICRAYYEKAGDKRLAIYEMLHLKNAKEFLRKSGWEGEVMKYSN